MSEELQRIKEEIARLKAQYNNRPYMPRQQVTIETYYSKLPEETMQAVMKALAEREYFGLKGRKSVVVFCIGNLRSYWINQKGKITANYQYTTEQAFIDGVKMQLITHREFISRLQLIEAIDPQLLTG